MAESRIIVISDLHLGGRPDRQDKVGSQICHTYRQLTGFIDWLTASMATEGPLELVINGEFVDLLADDDPGDGSLPPRPWTPDEGEALARLERVVAGSRAGHDRGPFEALRDLVTSGGDLTLLIGNHDVELALPAVRRRLERLLDGGKGRLRLIYDGEAYSRGDLLIEHGNRYDPWNIVDHSALRQERSMASRGLLKEEQEQERAERYFVPPAGSLMVVHVINQLKRHFRFVDLLKPEDGAVLPLLLTLDPKVQRVLETILETAPLWEIRKRVKRGGLRRNAEPDHSGNLGGMRDDGTTLLARELRRELEGAASDFLIPADPAHGGDLSAPSLQEMLKKLQRLGDKIGDGLALLQQLAAWEDEDRLQRLHKALRRLNRDDCFDTTRESEAYREAAAELLDSGRFSTVIFGHTHLPKDIRLTTPSGRHGRYLNTGTWADVMRLPEEVLADYPQARPALLGFLEDLLNNRQERYVQRYLSWAEVRMRDEQVWNARLHSWCGEGREREAPLRA